MSFDNVVPMPVYSMVDFNKKRKDREAKNKARKAEELAEIVSDSESSSKQSSARKAEEPKEFVEIVSDSESSSKQSNPVDESRISCGKSLSPRHKYEDIKDIQQEPPAPETTRANYTTISKETLLSPEGSRYEDTHISENTSLPKKGEKKLKCIFVIFGLLFLLAGIGAGFAFTSVIIFELKSQLLKLKSGLLNSTSGISGLMQSFSEISVNHGYRYSRIADCAAINQTLLNNTESLNELLVQHQYLVDTLENLGQPSSPAASCASLLAFSPTTPSGYYWVRASNGSAVRVYCDMTRSCGGVTGGWTRVVSLNYSNDSTPCPSGLQEQTDFGIRTCAAQSPHATCASVLFSTSGVAYSTVCGKVLAYPLGSTGAFSIFRQIDSNYVDGVSLTHGSNPRKHIWTFAAALDESSAGEAVCECSNQEHVGGQPPAFVGQDYFCDSGATTSGATSSPLWDGSGCGPDSTCCSFNNPPWFYKQLPSPTSDGIEMRVCRDEERDTEGIAISFTELLVR
jgi:hypothetical protein